MVDLGDDLCDLVDHPGRQAERGLVQEQHPGLGHERAADGENLLLASGQQRRRLRAALLEAREELEDPGPSPRSWLAAVQGHGARAQVVLDGEVAEYAPA